MPRHALFALALSAIVAAPALGQFAPPRPGDGRDTAVPSQSENDIAPSRREHRLLRHRFRADADRAEVPWQGRGPADDGARSFRPHRGGAEGRAPTREGTDSFRPRRGPEGRGFDADVHPRPRMRMHHAPAPRGADRPRPEAAPRRDHDGGPAACEQCRREHRNHARPHDARPHRGEFAPRGRGGDSEFRAGARPPRGRPEGDAVPRPRRIGPMGEGPRREFAPEPFGQADRDMRPAPRARMFRERMNDGRGDFPRRRPAPPID